MHSKALLIFALAVLLPCSAQAATLTYQSVYPENHAVTVKGEIPWLQDMTKLSGGTLQFHENTGESHIRSEEAPQALISGRLDMASLFIFYQASFFPYSRALELPGLAEDSRQASALFWKAYEEIPEIKAELDKVGKVLTVWGSDRTGLFSTKGPILSPADLKDRRVLVWSVSQVDMVAAWGGVPVQISPQDTYSALQHGMGDVFLGPLPNGLAFNLYTVARNITVLPSTSLLLMEAVSWKAWKALSPEEQKAMEANGGAVASKKFGQLLFDYTNQTLSELRRKGCTISLLSPDQANAFYDAGKQNIKESWSKDLARMGVKNAPAWVDKIYSFARSVPPQL